MSSEQLRVALLVYISAIVPLLLITYLTKKRALPNWVVTVYACSFIACAVGWELWFTYGWIDGDPVYLRRGPATSLET